MFRSVALKSLWDQRRSLVWWSVGFVAVVLLLVLIYPSIRDLAELEVFIDNLPEALRNLMLGAGAADFLSPTGFLNSRFFAFLAPGMLLVYAISTGAGAIAGEEERGTLEVLLAAPIARWRVVVEKFAALTGGVVLLVLVSFVVLWLGGAGVGLNVPAGRLAEASVSLALLGVFSGAMALAIGAATGGRGLGVGVATGFAVTGYLVNALAPLVGVLDAVQPATAFYYYAAAAPLVDGLNLAHVGVLVLATAFLVGVAVVGLGRRDLRA